MQRVIQVLIGSQEQTVIFYYPTNKAYEKTIDRVARQTKYTAVASIKAVI